MNPYDFVQLGRPPARRSIKQDRHEAFHKGKYSGRIVCKLTARTPLCVPDATRARREVAVAGKRPHLTLDFLRVEKALVIPGTSLKGVIRTVAEAVSHSCLTMTKGDYGRAGTYNIPGEFRHCTSADALCPACRLFGWLEHGNVWMGKVSIGEARSPEGQYTLGNYMTLLPLSAPKPHHTAFYDPQGKKQVRGRKFYFHHPQAAQPGGVLTASRKTDQNRTVQPALPGSVFTFTVDYADLAADELAVLLYSLALEDGVYHKIGSGKPVGLGSAQIELAALTEYDLGGARYRKLGGGVGARLEGDALQSYLTAQLAGYRTNQSDVSLQDLRRIWKFDHKLDIRYPAKDWFNDHSQTTIDKT
jgi:CRISPR/Cas system CSM-associated protein Csm3 (group 7 of RAMP superfamily)